MKKEIDISEDLGEIIIKFINSHSKYDNFNEFATAAFEFFLKNDEFLQSNINILDKTK